MKMKTVLVSALSILALGTAALVNVQGVMADTPNIAKSDYDPSKVKYLKVQMSLSQDTSSGKLKITASIDTFPEGMNEVSIPFFLFNVETQVTKKFPGLADAIFTPSQPSVTREYDMNQANLNAFADGEYRIVLRDWKQPPHDYYRYYGHTEIVTIQDHKMVGTGTHIDQAKNGWFGNSYYKNGVKARNEYIRSSDRRGVYYVDSDGNLVENKWFGNFYFKPGGLMAQQEWIYDNYYKSYYYLTSNGSYARNAWIGNYYLKSNGKMAKSEWIYDRNYGAYYYLTSEGSYARNTWVGDYYLKANGKMAVNERTPDGYRVDGSGKWIR